MRFGSVTLIWFSMFMLAGVADAGSQTCTGLCLQQTMCPGTTTTSISGVVYAPNGIDPLPNVTVYIPNAPVAPFTVGVSCPVVGTPPSGSPLIGTTTGVDGSFTLTNVPVGTNIPLVIVSGRWRRQVIVPGTVACANTALPSSLAVMPQNRSQGDIPKIAIATGSADEVECVLRKVGISDSEFTDPSGGGRINLYLGSHDAGAQIDAATPSETALMGSSATLNSYDLLMLPCEGGQYTQPASQLANLVTFANSGGRVYSSHFSYAWMYQNPPFDGVARWDVDQADPPDGTASVNTSFAEGNALAKWLQLTRASTTPGQIPVSTLRVDTDGVIAPTQSWLTLNNAGAGNPVMQFVFDTPIAPAGATVNQCGRVLFNEYHVESPLVAPTGVTFPNECPTGAMTPQEKLLEYMLFELTNEGGQPTLSPTSQNFGSEAIGLTSAPQTFTWTNNSSFATQVSSVTASGDFVITSNNCSSVAGGANCQIQIAFAPTSLGVRTGTLTVVSPNNSLTASLTGTGTPGFSLSSTSLSFGSVDVGFSATQSFTLTNQSSGALAVPAFVTTGPYSVSAVACGTSLASLKSCLVNVTFTPSSPGSQAGTAIAASANPLYSGLTVSLNGNGVDFAISFSPASGSVVAGDEMSSTAILQPMAGFNAPLSLICNVAATASSCGLGEVQAVGAANVQVSIRTTSNYTIVGYGGLDGRYLWLIGFGSGWLLWRKRAGRTRQARLFLAFLAMVCGLSLLGCTGKLPDKNPEYTAPGSYLVTVTATDGFLVHSATYTLTVNAK